MRCLSLFLQYLLDNGVVNTSLCVRKLFKNWITCCRQPRSESNSSSSSRGSCESMSWGQVLICIDKRQTKNSQTFVIKRVYICVFVRPTLVVDTFTKQRPRYLRVARAAAAESHVGLSTLSGSQQRDFLRNVVSDINIDRYPLQ